MQSPGSAGDLAGETEEIRPEGDPIVSEPLPCSLDRPGLGQAEAVESSAIVDSSKISGVIEFIMDPRPLSCSDEAGNGEEMHGKDEKEFAKDIGKEYDEVLDRVGTLISDCPSPTRASRLPRFIGAGNTTNDAAKAHWTCQCCGEENRAARMCCNNCSQGRGDFLSSQQAHSRSCSEDSAKDYDFESRSSDSRSSESPQIGARPQGSPRPQSVHSTGDASPAVMTPNVVDDDGESSECAYTFSSSGEASEHDNADAEASCSKAAHWLCLFCDEENRADRAWCNNCARGQHDCWITRRKAISSGESQEDVGAREYDAAATCSEDTEPHWICACCDEENRAVRSWCNNCGSCRGQREDRPAGGTGTRAEGAEQLSTAEAKVPPDSRRDPKTHWTCSQCDEINLSSRPQCHNCEYSTEETSRSARHKDGSPKDAGAVNLRDRHNAESSPYKSPWDWTPSRKEGTHAAEEPSPSADSVSSSMPEDVLEDEETECLVAKEHVLLHIYDVFADERVQAVNDVFRTVGTGAFHAGVEVRGKEWSYGYTPWSTGLVFCPPKSNSCHRYRETLNMGATPLSSEELEDLLNELAKEWSGQEYDLLLHNCCHFCDAFCVRLGVGPLPVWVTNLAGAGARLVDGVSSAALTMNGIFVAGAERAAALDERYNILSTMDSFTTREIAIDETYLESKVQSLWTQAKQNIEHVGKNIGNVGMLAGRAVDEVQKPVGAKQAQIASAFSHWWGWGPQSQSKALVESHTTV